jgi:hypothetical protein
MKLQFSLATLLVCIVAIAIDATVCSALLVRERKTMKYYLPDIIDDEATFSAEIKPPHPANIDENTPTGDALVEIKRRPHIAEILLRMAWSAPLTVCVALATLWAIRRLKSRRHTEPPVG